jgi:lysine 2,3-aminomutase
MEQSFDTGTAPMLESSREPQLDTPEEPPDQPPSLTSQLSFFPVAHDRFPAPSNSNLFRLLHFPATADAEWNDWHWQLKNRITTLGQLEKILNLTDDEVHAVANLRLPLSITPYYASLLHPDDPTQSLRRSVVPVSRELTISPGESSDPLNEEDDSPTPGLVHRYPDRVLFLVTNFCSTNCRYCTRSRIVGKRSRCGLGLEQWEKAIAYIERTPEIRDVLLSGGDPLTLPDTRLEWLLNRLRRIPHVEVIRLGTKAPMVLPQRITPALVRMLKRFHPLWLSIHCTHPNELTPEAITACRRLADAGIPLGSQTVLLAGINDDAEIMTKLMQGLMRMRIKPYYLYQCDPIVGSAHFRTPVRKGLEIYAALRGHTSGYAVPNYVIDAPGGGGKIPLLPETVISMEDGKVLLKNYEGKIFSYPDTASLPDQTAQGRLEAVA